MTTIPAPPRSDPHANLDAFLAALDLHRYRTRAYRESIVVLRALRLAPSLEVCEAILRGERVPKSRLDPEWERVYALR